MNIFIASKNIIFHFYGIKSLGENDKIFKKQSYRPALHLYKKMKNGNKLENGKIEFIAIYPFFANKLKLFT